MRNKRNESITDFPKWITHHSPYLAVFRMWGLINKSVFVIHCYLYSLIFIPKSNRQKKNAREKLTHPSQVSFILTTVLIEQIVSVIKKPTSEKSPTRLFPLHLKALILVSRWPWRYWLVETIIYNKTFDITKETQCIQPLVYT